MSMFDPFNDDQRRVLNILMPAKLDTTEWGRRLTRLAGRGTTQGIDNDCIMKVMLHAHYASGRTVFNEDLWHVARAFRTAVKAHDWADAATLLITIYTLARYGETTQ